MSVRLTFQPFSLLKPHIRHALNAPKHATTEAQAADDEIPGPGLLLTKGAGVHLQSNGRPLSAENKLVPIFAQRMRPKVPGWWNNMTEALGTAEFVEFVGVNEQMLEAPDDAALWIEIGEEEMTVTIVV